MLSHTTMTFCKFDDERIVSFKVQKHFFLKLKVGKFRKNMKEKVVPPIWNPKPERWKLILIFQKRSKISKGLKIRQSLFSDPNDPNFRTDPVNISKNIKWEVRWGSGRIFYVDSPCFIFIIDFFLGKLNMMCARCYKRCWDFCCCDLWGCCYFGCCS